MKMPSTFNPRIRIIIIIIIDTIESNDIKWIFGNLTMHRQS